MSKSVLLIIVKNCAEMLISFPKECNKAYALKKKKKSFSCYVIPNIALKIFQSPFSLSGIYMCDARYFLLTGL